MFSHEEKSQPPPCVFFKFIYLLFIYFLICLDMGPFPFQIFTGLNVGDLKCIQSTQYLTVKKT